MRELAARIVRVVDERSMDERIAACRPRRLAGVVLGRRGLLRCGRQEAGPLPRWIMHGMCGTGRSWAAPQDETVLACG